MKVSFLLIITFFQLSAAQTDEKLDLPSTSYEVVNVHGVFGTYWPIAKGDVLVFDPSHLLQTKQSILELKPGKVSPIDRPYLSLHDFRLETIMYEKGEIIGYSFVSRYGATGGIYSKLRFDLRTDWETMFIVYEANGIIHGIIDLKKQQSERDAASDL